MHAFQNPSIKMATLSFYDSKLFIWKRKRHDFANVTVTKQVSFQTLFRYCCYLKHDSYVNLYLKFITGWIIPIMAWRGNGFRFPLGEVISQAGLKTNQITWVESSTAHLTITLVEDSGMMHNARWNYHSCARHLVGYSKLSFPKIWYIPLCRNKESFEIYTCNNIFFSMKHWYEMKLLLVGSAFWRRKSEIQWKCSWLYEIIKCGELWFFFKFYNYKVC